MQSNMFFHLKFCVGRMYFIIIFFMDFVNFFKFKFPKSELQMDIREVTRQDFFTRLLNASKKLHVLAVFK